MHTSVLKPHMLEIEIGGVPVEPTALWPAWTRHDRLGVVVTEPVGAIGASLLVYAAMAAFYADVRARAGELPCFAEHFLFHVGRRWGDHGMLDVWPDHKEVVVETAGEPLAQAINDRAITRLAVPSRTLDGGAREIPSYTLASARNRILSAFAYDSCGRVDGADVRITGTRETEEWVAAVIRASRGFDGVSERALGNRRVAVVEGGRPIETYRRLPLNAALRALSA